MPCILEATVEVEAEARPCLVDHHMAALRMIQTVFGAEEGAPGAEVTEEGMKAAEVEVEELENSSKKKQGKSQEKHLEKMEIKKYHQNSSRQMKKRIKQSKFNTFFE